MDGREGQTDARFLNSFLFVLRIFSGVVILATCKTFMFIECDGNEKVSSLCQFYIGMGRVSSYK